MSLRNNMAPGDLARVYAKRKGWILRHRSIMVEGDIDVKYLELASRLYKEVTSYELIGQDLSIFACGSGPEGGTSCIFEQFPILVKIIKADPDHNGKNLFRCIALIDKDIAGKKLCEKLVKHHRDLKTNREIFLLQYVFPRTTSEPNALTSQIKKANSLWDKLDCEMEDLLGNNFIEVFLLENPNALVKEPNEKSGIRHYEWNGSAKDKLCKTAISQANIDDVKNLVELLKSFRFYLGLPVDGVKKEHRTNHFSRPAKPESLGT
jgi:hypothetical protein